MTTLFSCRTLATVNAAASARMLLAGAGVIVLMSAGIASAEPTGARQSGCTATESGLVEARASSPEFQIPSPGSIPASAAAWEQKLDGTLQTAADASPDAVLRVVVRLAAQAPAAKAQDLASFGFWVVETRDARTLVLELSAREAMVLAEDADFTSFAIDTPPRR